MNRRRKLLIVFAAGALATPLFAQTQKRIWRIGYLAGGVRPPSLTTSNYGGFPQGMRELGYVEERDFVMEWRFADGENDRLAPLAAELVRLKVDVIVCTSTRAVAAAKQATTTIPIVMATSFDPVGNGFVASLARPGGNITGQATGISGNYSKLLQLLMTVMPKLSRIATLAMPGNPGNAVRAKDIQVAAQTAGVRVLPVEARTLEEVERGFDLMTRQRCQAFILSGDAFFMAHRHRIADLALQHRILSCAQLQDYAAAGFLMSYGSSLFEENKMSASYVHKILQGALPGDLPVQQPIKFELVVNLKTAKALGIKIPQSLTLLADKVIE